MRGTGTGKERRRLDTLSDYVNNLQAQFTRISSLRTGGVTPRAIGVALTPNWQVAMIARTGGGQLRDMRQRGEEGSLDKSLRTPSTGIKVNKGPNK